MDCLEILDHEELEQEQTPKELEAGRPAVENELPKTWL